MVTERKSTTPYAVFSRLKAAIRKTLDFKAKSSVFVVRRASEMRLSFFGNGFASGQADHFATFTVTFTAVGATFSAQPAGVTSRYRL